MRHVRALTWILLLSLLVVLPGCPLVGLTTSATDADTHFAGQVLDMTGKPAANVLVHGYLISNNSGSLVSNNAASLVSNNTASLVSNNTAAYKTQAAQLEVRTDASGRFSLKSDATELNLEAVLSDDVKAMSLNVPQSAKSLQMQLAYTGSIAGRVTAPDTGVSNFEGVDVFIPGTSYLAKTDASGNYVLSNVAPGTFNLVASKAGLGRAVQTLQVKSKETTQAPELGLTLNYPTITAVAPTNAAPGQTVTVDGDHFGATTGDVLVVSFNGSIATKLKRVSDRQITVTVPDNATTGNIVVMVGGVISNALPFGIFKTLSLDPGNLTLAVGETRSLTPSALDTTGNLVPEPAVTWSSAGAAITLHDGVVTAAAPGEATVTITSGRLTSTRQVHVVSHYAQVSTVAGGITGYSDGQGSSGRFSSPYGLAMLPDGHFLVADTDNNRIREVTPDGMVTTFAGTGEAGGTDGTRDTAEFDQPNCLARDADGDLYVTEFVSRIRRISPSGEVTVFAGNGTDGYQDGPVAEAMFNSPYGIVVAPDDTLFVADTYNHCIRQISGGIVSTLAGNGSAGSADGHGTAARFNKPRGIALDADGNLIVADTDNHTIRKVTRDGTVTTIAGGKKPGYYDGNQGEALFRRPVTVAVDAAGLLYVGDMDNHVIRRVTPEGVVSTYAGDGTGSFGDGAAPKARFWLPSGLAFDGNGTLFVVDDRVRKIEP